MRMPKFSFRLTLIMKMRTLTRLVGTLTLFVAAACGSSNQTSDKPIVPSSQGTSTTKATKGTTSSTSGTAKRGLDAAGNDPALVALAREALECYQKANCEAQRKWYEPFHLGRQVDFKTLVNLVEDEHPEIRSLAVGILRGKKGQPGFHTDVALATRVLDALEREQDEHVAREIALAAGFIDVKATGLESRMLNIMRMDTRERVRVAITESILSNNWDVPTVTAAVKGMTGDASSDVRAAAIRAFDVAELRAEACPFWQSTLIDKDMYLVDKCFYHLVAHSCKGEYEAMLREAERRPPVNPENLQPLCRPDELPDALRSRFVDDLETWSMKTNLQAAQRVQSLKLLASCDPVRAKKVVDELVKDKDEAVRETAADVKKNLPKKP